MDSRIRILSVQTRTCRSNNQCLGYETVSSGADPDGVNSRYPGSDYYPMMLSGRVCLFLAPGRCFMGSFTIPVVIVLMATFLVLLFGIFSMARGGTFDRQHSVQLMFTRVGFQAAAIILVIIAAMYAARLG